MTDHTDVHWSGLVTATDEQWTKFAHVVGASEASTAAFTECRVDLDLGADWDQYRPAHPTVAECRVAWRNTEWLPVFGTQRKGRHVPAEPGCGEVSLTDKEFHNGAGTRPGVAMTWVLLVRNDKPGGTLLRCVAHLPASVEQGDKFRARSKRVVAYQSALLGLRREIRALKKQHRPDAVILSCDWNVDFKRRSWRLAIAAALKGTGLHLVVAPARKQLLPKDQWPKNRLGIRRKKYRYEGTHTSRVIDAHAVTRPTTGHAHIWKSLHPFDHRGVELTLTKR